MTNTRKMYEYLDRRLKIVVTQIYDKFQRYKAMPFDELNTPPVSTRIRQLYAELADLNYDAYWDIFEYYWVMEMGDEEKTPKERFLKKILREPNPVMKYSYESESIRKRDRLVEALIGTRGDPKEMDKARNYWTQQTGWFGVEVVDGAVKEARRARGVKLVRWCSEHDDKTCGECLALDGMIFTLEELPTKPHPNCRCWTEVVE